VTGEDLNSKHSKLVGPVYRAAHLGLARHMDHHKSTLSIRTLLKPTSVRGFVIAPRAANRRVRRVCWRAVSTSKSALEIIWLMRVYQADLKLFGWQQKLSVGRGYRFFSGLIAHDRLGSKALIESDAASVGSSDEINCVVA